MGTLLTLFFVGFLLNWVFGPWLILFGVLFGLEVLFGGKGKRKQGDPGSRVRARREERRDHERIDQI